MEGLRVVDFTWVMAGPYCTRFLGDFGAEVIKIQSEEIGRAEPVHGFNSFWNRNKLSVTINMSTTTGREVCKRLIKISDVVVDNFSARVLRQWGLDWESTKSLHSDLIMVSMAGMGHSGPMRDYVSFGPTLHAMAGVTALSTFPGHGPLGFGYSYADHVGGLTGAMAVLQALNYRYRTGKGQFIDVAQLEGMSALLSTAPLECTINGKPPKPMGNRNQNPAAAPHGIYRCKGDDRWVAIAVFSDGEWASFCRAIGAPEWTKKPELATSAGRNNHEDELDRLVEEWTGQHAAEEVMHLLQNAGVRAGVVQNAEDIVENDPQLLARSMWVHAEHPELGKCYFDGTPLKFSETPQRLRRAVPELGQDNDYIFGELLGMSQKEIGQLADEGVLR